MHAVKVLSMCVRRLGDDTAAGGCAQHRAVWRYDGRVRDDDDERGQRPRLRVPSAAGEWTCPHSTRPPPVHKWPQPAAAGAYSGYVVCHKKLFAEDVSVLCQ